MADAGVARRQCRVGLIGAGAIGTYLARSLKADGIAVSGVLVRSGRLCAAQHALEGHATIYDTLTDFLDQGLELVIECAGQNAVATYGADILRNGTDFAIISTGALASPELYRDLHAAASVSGARIVIPHGAVAGCEALSAACHASLDKVTYIARKPPLAWQGSPAETVCDLASLRDEQVIYDGTARLAARDFPQNANVAAIIALAGIGFDETRVKLIADPAATQNTHRLVASGAFGELDVMIAAHPFPENCKTSMLAALSLARLVRQRIDPLVI